MQILLGGEQIKYHANFVADSWLGDINESMMFTLADTHFFNLSVNKVHKSYRQQIHII